ncbi:hypothetical protein C8J57DRAFT_1077031 [Mycena rebaudengoi]|nr:hypothetical protein C8J57DRAFT_1077031 [Mycena rebaudengoi]
MISDIRSAVDPNPRSAVNKSHAGWQAYYLIMYVFGFFWGCVNIVAWMWYFQRKNISGSTGRSLIRSRVLRYSWRLGHILVLFPVAVIMCLGPFFAPTIGINLSRENAWLHRCDSYMVEVVLGGLAFSSPQDATPIAAFYFRQPDGRLEKQQEYHLINDRDDIWHLTPAGQTPSSLPTVTYYLGNSTLSATCTTPNATICTVGSFQESGFLTFSIVDAFNKSTVTLRAVDKEWVYGKADDAPSYILREVQDKGDLGAVVVRTAVTNLHDCTSLKLCANSANVQTLVPVGLTLLKQNEYSKVCTTPNSN